MLHACTLGRKIGLVTVSPAFVQFCEEQIARHGLERRVVAVRAMDPRPGQFNRAFEDEGALVLNGLPVAVAAAETAIRLGRLGGTAASRRGAYALAPGGAVAEFRAAFPSSPVTPQQ